MKILYVQPHWDDVGLSQILHVKAARERGDEVTLITFFNGGPKYKKEELDKFCSDLGIVNKDFGLPDCSVYRRPVTRPYWHDIVKASKANKFDWLSFWSLWYEKHMPLDEMTYFVGELIDNADEVRIPTGYFHPAHYLTTAIMWRWADYINNLMLYREFPYSSYVEPNAPLDAYCSRIRNEPSFSEVSNNVTTPWGGFLKGGESTLATASVIAANASTPSIDRLNLILKHFPSQASNWDAAGPNFKAHGHPNDFIERLYHAHPIQTVPPTV